MRFSIGLPPNLDFALYGRLAALVERHDFTLLVIDDIVIFKPPLGPDPTEAIRLLGERVIAHFRS